MSSGVNFAIPIDTVVRTIPYLIVYGTTYKDRYWISVIRKLLLHLMVLDDPLWCLVQLWCVHWMVLNLTKEGFFLELKKNMFLTATLVAYSPYLFLFFHNKVQIDWMQDARLHLHSFHLSFAILYDHYYEEKNWWDYGSKYSCIYYWTIYSSSCCFSIHYLHKNSWSKQLISK